jgi:hypothetical protein
MGYDDYLKTEYGSQNTKLKSNQPLGTIAASRVSYKVKNSQPLEM